MKAPSTKDDSIVCPGCGEIIPLTETLQNQFTQKVKSELTAEWGEKLKREKEIEKIILA